MADLWAARPKGRRCRYCVAYVEKKPIDTSKTYTVIGRCRRHAPVVQEGYPVVFPDDWCCDFKMDENKI
jgi:hypothetical protein